MCIGCRRVNRLSPIYSVRMEPGQKNASVGRLPEPSEMPDPYRTAQESRPTTRCRTRRAAATPVIPNAAKSSELGSGTENFGASKITF